MLVSEETAKSCDRTCPAQISLAQLRPGESGVVCSATLEPAEAELLAAMGLMRETRVTMCRPGEPCIIAVSTGRPGSAVNCSCRLGIARPLAKKIFVSHP